MTTTKKICATIVFAFSTLSAMAGGILTNTNQSVSFLRNPARDGAIGLDGVYSNPAGVAFLNEGFHFGFNWQAAWQTRTIETTNPLFAMGADNNGATTKTFKGTAKAPVIPSLQAAYNTGKWSFQFNFSVTGGGGKCTFDNGLGSFESAVGSIAYALNSLGANTYNAGYYMQGSQFYFGVTLGAAYKVTDNLSVYGGLRGLYGKASYKAKIEDITVNGNIPFGTFLDGIQSSYGQLESLYNTYGEYTPEPYLTQYKQLSAAMPRINALEVYRNGVNLQCDQTGFGVAPILGVDYKVGNFNFAAKYEFRTHMGMKNKSTLKEAMAIEAVNQFQDGKTVREDSPALFTLGAQWSILPNVRVNGGLHYFFDKQSQKYGDKQELLDKGTREYLGGIEYDPIDKLTVSAGFQVTRYGLTDEYMSDLSFVTNSWSYGLGAKYQINDKVAVQAAYFKTKYDHYKQEAADASGSINDFTRSNRVAGIGVELTF